jgi:transcriptional regulator with XRE-family HTH domain
MQSKKLTRQERAICQRFTNLRRILDLSQKELADGLGFPFDRVAAIENYRTCLKLDIMLRLVDKYGVNPGWLAEHTGPVFLKIELDFHMLVISHSFNQSLAECYVSTGMMTKVRDSLIAAFPESSGGETGAAKKAILAMAQGWIERDLRPDHLWTFLEEMKSHAGRLIRGWDGGENAAREKSEP